MWTLLIIIFILWLLGFSFEIAGNLIHILLVIAFVILIIRLITGRKV
ncbi:lmo0937 family membrane protein [Alkalihalobacillus deserti]|nr:lmo0937 family membrane protein [Alkalihalobacillus deserti]